MTKRGWFKDFAIGSTMVWITLFVVVPYLFVLLFSFLKPDPERIIVWNFTFVNYHDIFSPIFLFVCWYSLVLALITTIITGLTAYPFAFILARLPKGIQRILLLFMIIPFWTSSLIRTYALIILLKANGIINTFLLYLGLINEPVMMLYTQTAVFIGLVYTLLPFMILPIYSSIQKLDWRLIEAARDLGGTSHHIFFRIILPLTLPGIIAGSTMVFLPALGLFYIPDLLGGARVMLIGNFIKNQFLTSNNWPLGSAASMVLTLIMCLFLYVYFLSSQKARTEGVGGMA
ncbi:MAG TPA: ABC transporter permease subunit [Desulfomonilia bacterium]|nr:ABC transporter permease subunit [Desulfomonilia bacterium]